jgi:dihydrofolate synthase / folylpolyglutamate synthase
MSRNYQQTLDYLYSALPMFQRVGSVAFKKDLGNTIALCNFLGNPQNKFKCIHVGGTNGKGSSSHMLASILQEAGYTTGLYTSPHLKDFTERIRINGVPADYDFVIDFVDRIKPQIELLKPSFFEITVAMAFDYFAKQQIDVAVIEVGLGGRLDSTNVITPILSLITNIGSDHKDLLGDSPQQIAFEKAGIIKLKVPVVISEKQDEVLNVFLEKAKTENAPIYFASDDWQCVRSQASATFNLIKNGSTLHEGVDLTLSGNYQLKNIPGVLKSIELLNDSEFRISDEQLIKGLQNVISNTGIKGRWQVLANQPLTICDTGHNLEGIQEVLTQIKQQNYQHLHMVWGSVKDKDIHAILSILPKEASYYFCQAKIPRAMPAEELNQKAQEFGLDGIVVPDVNDALATARANAKTNDMIFIGGSTFVVAELNEL